MRGAWVAQLVKRPRLCFGSAHDPRVVESSPTTGFLLSGESASPLPLPLCSLSLSQMNK